MLNSVVGISGFWLENCNASRLIELHSSGRIRRLRGSASLLGIGGMPCGRSSIRQQAGCEWRSIHDADVFLFGHGQQIEQPVSLRQ